VTEPGSPGPCPRCVFTRCGYAGPGSARCAVAMPSGQVTEGWLCRPHQVLLAAAGFGVHLVVGYGGQAGPCGWLVPAEEAFAADGAVPDEADLREAVP
jgi:hypothetical protein